MSNCVGTDSAKKLLLTEPRVRYSHTESEYEIRRRYLVLETLINCQRAGRVCLLGLTHETAQ